MTHPVPLNRSRRVRQIEVVSVLIRSGLDHRHDPGPDRLWERRPGVHDGGKVGGQTTFAGGQGKGNGFVDGKRTHYGIWCYGGRVYGLRNRGLEVQVLSGVLKPKSRKPRGWPRGTVVSGADRLPALLIAFLGFRLAVPRRTPLAIPSHHHH